MGFLPIPIPLTVELRRICGLRYGYSGKHSFRNVYSKSSQPRRRMYSRRTKTRKHHLILKFYLAIDESECSNSNSHLAEGSSSAPLESLANQATSAPKHSHTPIHESHLLQVAPCRNSTCLSPTWSRDLQVPLTTLAWLAWPAGSPEPPPLPNYGTTS